MDALALLAPDVQDFIKRHAQDDVTALALKKSPDPAWPYALILDQIKARQKAAVKIPAWPKTEDIIFPASNVIEQCSSQATATYKATLCEGNIFTDLTGGTGVDCQAIAQKFKSGFCIEQDKSSAALLAHNLPLLGSRHVKVLHQRAEDFIRDMPEVDLVYLDPQRRDYARKGKYILEDCTPDITALLSVLKERTQRILLKTSPMLDIDETIRRLGIVESVHVLEWQGECKEVLYMFNPAAEGAEPSINAAALDDKGFPVASFSFTRAQEEAACVDYGLPQKYLFEPGPAFQKAGGFASMAEHYNVQKLHKHTHLYTASTPCPAFPGRHFEIFDMVPAQKKKLSITKANLTLRNFPGTTAALREKLGLAEGGDTYIFACTLANNQKMLLLARKT